MAELMSTLAAPRTPALLLHRGKLDANLARMRAQMARFGARFRPHVKTAKSIDVVRRAFAGGHGPITVSTLREADLFLEAGFTDILYAVGLAPDKLPEVLALEARGARMSVIIDSVVAADALVQNFRVMGVRTDVLIEIDSDKHRASVDTEGAEFVEIGKRLAAEGLLAGVLTHAGGSYQCNGAAELVAHAALEREATVRAAERLRAVGLTCSVTSIGSTPTALFAEDLTGVSEVRAGVFMFQDLVMAGIGVCRQEDIALTVLTTVIGHRAASSRLIIDAGWMALSRDRGTAQQAVDQGYGVICDLDGRILQDLIVVAANQEHGLAARRDGTPIDFSAFPIGARLRILPNHACATAAQHGAYLVTDDNQTIADEWRRFGGW